ncbi:hypothetical protein BN946_scf184909.g94 [Trametes cinnabarina]|uniref:Uncharacterized protein n=1 Tax=Pycnoporus cinnabarinus TaxID=5643 RepID=A0A060SAW5_PYCCI|nr:hypothetical protein BN946_scf184909.g94 [Trametes cinnabarina]
MAHKAIRFGVEEFVAHFLKAPGSSSTDTPPTLSFNPSKDIANAAEMLESTISALFVEAVNKHDLALGPKMPVHGGTPAVKQACCAHLVTRGPVVDSTVEINPGRRPRPPHPTHTPLLTYSLPPR